MKLIDSIKSAGVVGAGGGGFPTHIKLSSEIETFIINAAECEPLLSVDLSLLELFAGQIAEISEKILKELNIKEAVLAVKKKHTKAINLLNEKIRDKKKIKIFPLDDFYPAGDEFVLVYEVLGKLIPENGLPLNVKTAVNNVSTVLNIYRASLGIPVTERALTITGEVNNCGNYILPLGTTIRDALDFAGGLKTYPFTVISGGPMMGEIVKDLSTPVIKTTGGLIVLPVKHPLITRKEKDILHEFKSANSACDQCRYCTDLCPRFLLGHEMEPHKVMQALAHSTNEEELSRSFLCCGCQVCSYYACPLFLSPGKILQKIRMDLVKNKIKNTYCKSGLKTSMFRNFRKLPFNRLVARLGLADYAANLKSYFNKSFFPKKVILPLKQHAGSPAKPIVEKNQKVEKGNLIAEIQENGLGANIHASIDGVIENISEYSITIKSC